MDLVPCTRISRMSPVQDISEGGVSLVSSYQSHSQADDTELEEIDQDGDVIIKCGPKDMRVSSKILKLASSEFKKHFENECPILLSYPDVNPEALSILLNTLHFSRKYDGLDPDPDLQLGLIHAATRYGCIHSVRGTAQHWLHSSTRKENSLATWMKLSTIALRIDLGDIFENITARLSKELSVNDFDSSALMLGVSPSLKGLLRGSRTRLILTLVQEIENAFEKLRHRIEDYRQDDIYGKRCIDCNRWKPSATRKCGNCKNVNFAPLYCTSEFRTGRFVNMLHEVWPLRSHLEQSPLSFTNAVVGIKLIAVWTHNCIKECPLLQAVDEIKIGTQKVMAEFQGIHISALEEAEAAIAVSPARADMHI